MIAKTAGAVSLEPFGLHALPDLYVVSWLTMTPNEMDCHVYALRGTNGIVLIDCGTTWGHERILRNMAHWGLDPADVRTILFTHGHVDHVQGGPLWKQRGDVEILAHPACAAEAERQWNAPPRLKPAPRVDGFLNEGDRLSRCGIDFQVFHNPGHTAGCLSYLTTINDETCLFSGDIVMSNGLPGWRGDPAHDLAKIRAGIVRLRQLNFTHLAHGHDFLPNDRGQLFDFALEREAHGEWAPEFA